MPDLSIRGAVKRYGHVQASAGIDLEIVRGQFVTLLGPSGCGKTTLLRSIAGLEHLDAGTISIGERLVADPGARVFVPPEKRGLGMVFQSYALWPHLSVRGNIGYPLRVRRMPRAQQRSRVDELIRIVGLEGLDHRLIGEMSGGQQQRVALARALASGSDLVLYDEPLSNLDAGMRLAMRGEIRAIHNRLGMTSIFVTHDQEEALALSDRVILMKAGRIVQDGTPREVFSAPVDAFAARFLGFENIFTIDGIGLDGAGRPAVLVNGGALALPLERYPALDGSGGPVHGFAIKASHVRIGDAVRDGEGPVIDGVVAERSYVGDRTYFTVRAGGADVQVMVLNHLFGTAPSPRAGDAVKIQFPPELIAPLSAERELEPAIETSTVRVPR